MKRDILHSDLNCFYASVETVLHPEYMGKPIAVCGSEADRHGIVLAKSEPAKARGVKTGMVVREARRLCPGLIIVPPHHDMYHKFSNLVRQIYCRYTDMVEPFGLDECWLDITGCHGSTPAVAVAHEIRETVKRELGLTVSVGVSFNKVFAKLGSDMKKPDAVTEITEENFQDKVWPLQVSELLYAGRATCDKLRQMGIYTIGHLAAADPEMLRRRLGVGGTMLWSYACGEDSARVMHKDEQAEIKSVGHGITCNANLASQDEVRSVMLELCQDIGYKLATNDLLATGVQIDIKNYKLQTVQFMCKLPCPTRSRREIAECAYDLFQRKYKFTEPIRAVTVRAINPINAVGYAPQVDLFDDTTHSERLSKIESTVDGLVDKYGRTVLLPADVLANEKTKSELPYVTKMPHGPIK